MIIECSTCKKKYKLNQSQIPSGVKQAKCKACGKSIPLKPVVSPSQSSSSKATRTCPKCKHPLERRNLDECPNCGVIFNKYNIMMLRKREEEKRRKETRKKEKIRRKIQEEEERKANITNCPICKKEILKNADSCPHCGEPLKEEQPKQGNKNKVDRNSLKGCSGCLVLIFGGFVVLVIFSMFTANSPTNKNSNPSRSTSKATTEIVTNSAWDGSVYQVKTYLKRHLKDPDSFEAIEWSSVAKTENGYMVRCKYRAKNSFGGYIIENQIFILNKKGNVISVINK